MERTALLPLPQGLRITDVCQEETSLLITVLSERTSACCPLCGCVSDEVHSCYQRRLKDIPCGGQAICLQLMAHKFFCRNPKCLRKIFTERFPTFVEPWAQMTLRLSTALQVIGFATGGSLGARLAAHLGIRTSWMTILRRMMALPTPAPGAVTVLGIDDFSFKRGRKFGTILVDLVRHQVIDLLAERSSQSAADWMRQHPEFAYVSRDRGKDYAQGASDGAPQAVQVSDRFHLMKNFVEAVEAEISRCYKQLRQKQPPLPAPDLPAPEEWRQALGADVEQKQLNDKEQQYAQVKSLLGRGLSAKEIAQQLDIPVRRVYRWRDCERCPAHQSPRPPRMDKQERYEHIKALRVHGLSQKEIAQRLGIGVRTVQRWLKLEPAQVNAPRRKRRSIFDPYAAYVLSRWKQGERSVSLLWQEIRRQGFQGSLQTMYRFVRTLHQAVVSLPAPSVIDRIAVQQALWLLVRPFENLKAEERKDLQELCQASSQLAALHSLAQTFGQIIRKRERDQLSDWMKQVEASSFHQVTRFVAGLRRDKEEVLAGLTEVYSNGQVEGFVNKLKLIKRMGYGRAGFPLLRKRMLHAL
ncbi:MAG TPA: ISL3 family transposase [Ktedonobacteraceae bacterium]|nr:ISL3 family transposase [Ktedonobacteraceae bacterium]